MIHMLTVQKPVGRREIFKRRHQTENSITATFRHVGTYPKVLEGLSK